MTELQELFPNLIIDAWKGQSTKVAERHYLLVTDDHWKRAIDSLSPTGSPIANGARSIATHHETQKPLRNMPVDALQGLAMAGVIPRQGCVQSVKTLVETQGVGHSSADAELNALLELWPTLSKRARKECLRVAKEASKCES